MEASKVLLLQKQALTEWKNWVKKVWFDLLFYMLCMVVYVVKCGSEKKNHENMHVRGSRECVCVTVCMCGCVEVKN